MEDSEAINTKKWSVQNTIGVQRALTKLLYFFVTENMESLFVELINQHQPEDQIPSKFLGSPFWDSEG